ncbi:hypothetical protein H6P81_020944 [Aristolochia fimbriata]|uniref:TF-B3 domain-containing protein n=1 Tax=Aristolochia fimbriata TaxID=158543 RepID=A0AAV7DW78_ARIFI|nr:hypothetical protein H6P81_020944 [Aristolochia fimbriata]
MLNFGWFGSRASGTCLLCLDHIERVVDSQITKQDCGSEFLSAMAFREAAANDRRHSFVRIMLGNYGKRMRIPMVFHEHIEGKLQDRAVLRNANGRCWTVEVKRVGASLCFENGWPEFARDNLLQLVDFLSFTYDGQFTFDVTIYGKDGVEKKVPAQTNEELCISAEVQRKGKEDKAKSSRPCLCKYKKYKSIKRTEDSNEKTRCVFEVHKSCPFNLKNPHSAATYKSFRTNDIRLPKAFIAESGIAEEGTTPKVVLIDPRGKPWAMYMTQGGEGRWNFGNKWRECVIENNLLPGDICAFELIDSKNQCRRNTLQVHIFRKGENVGSHSANAADLP